MLELLGPQAELIFTPRERVLLGVLSADAYTPVDEIFATLQESQGWNECEATTPEQLQRRRLQRQQRVGVVVSAVNKKFGEQGIPYRIETSPDLKRVYRAVKQGYAKRSRTT